MSTDFESITVSNTTINLNPSKVNQSQRATITVEDDQIRFRIDSGDPATGHLVDDGTIIHLQSREEMEGFRAVRVTTDATIRVSYSKTEEVDIRRQ